VRIDLAPAGRWAGATARNDRNDLLVAGVALRAWFVASWRRPVMVDGGYTVFGHLAGEAEFAALRLAGVDVERWDVAAELEARDGYVGTDGRIWGRRE
jgi:hypothetical protein